jgi:hypothetical protein
MAIQHTFQQIRLHLVHLKKFPTGVARHRCEVIASTDAKGHTHVKLWRRFRNYCCARRPWHVDPSIRGPGGSEHPRWVFDHESGYRFSPHMFLPSEYDAPRYEEGELFPLKGAKQSFLMFSETSVPEPSSLSASCQ